MKIPAAPFLLLFAMALLAPVTRAEDKPRPDEFVYEGRTSSEWALQLKAGNAKAAHALSRLGKDAVGPLVQLLKDPDEKTSTTAGNVLAKLQLDKEALPVFLALLKDEHFEVRRTAVKLLGKSAALDPAIGLALRDMLKDRDKAVAEAAESVLNGGDVEQLLEEARGSLKLGDPKRAALLAERALALNPDHEQARAVKMKAAEQIERRRGDEEGWAAHMDAEARIAGRKKTVDTLLRQAREMIEKGEVERPLRIVTEAQKMFPDDPNVIDLRRQIERQREKTPGKKVGDVDVFDRVDKNEKLDRPEKDGDKLKKKKNVGEDNAQF